MNTTLQVLEIALGPWFSDDRPEDVYYDIRAFDPDAGALLTITEVAAYLAKKPPAFASKPHAR